MYAISPKKYTNHPPKYSPAFVDICHVFPVAPALVQPLLCLFPRKSSSHLPRKRTSPRQQQRWGSCLEPTDRSLSVCVLIIRIFPDPTPLLFGPPMNLSPFLTDFHCFIAHRYFQRFLVTLEKIPLWTRMHNLPLVGYFRQPTALLSSTLTLSDQLSCAPTEGHVFNL